MIYHIMVQWFWIITLLLLFLQHPIVVDSWITISKSHSYRIIRYYDKGMMTVQQQQQQQQPHLYRAQLLQHQLRPNYRLYSEPIVSSSSSSSASSSSSTKSNNTTSSSSTVLPFMATTDSVGINPVKSIPTTTTTTTTVSMQQSSSSSSSADDTTTIAATDTTMLSKPTMTIEITKPPPVAAAAAASEDDNDIKITTTSQQESSSSVLVDNEIDIHYMKIAIELAELDGGEHGPRSAYPNPTVGAILVSTDSSSGVSTIIGRGRSDYRNEAVRACLEDAGYVIAALSEWVVTYPIRVDVSSSSISSTDMLLLSTTTSPSLQLDASTTTTTPSTMTTRVRPNITLYTTLEPSTRRRGTATPPVTNLIRVANIQRVVIGCPSPVPEKAMLGATALHQSGIDVTLIQDTTIRNACQDIIHDFSISSNSKLQRMARKHYQLFGRPLGFLHCSVIHSDNIEAFRRNGNAFGSTSTTGSLSYRNFGTYELAPPPDNVWASIDTDIEIEDEYDDRDTGTSQRIDDEFVMIDFEDEETSSDMDTILDRDNSSPMMPWYNQVDAVVGTFPRSGNGPPNDDSIMSRLNGLKWLATNGNLLAAGVERILVLDATELRNLPLTNDDPNLPKGVDIEAFWRSTDRKPVRLLLRRGVHEAARAAANAAFVAAQAAADAAEIAANAIESGDATKAATAAIDCANSAQTSKRYIEQELETTQVIRRKLEDLGVIIETLPGGEPIDVMEHLGTRNGLYSVVWRAGCWGERGVRAILAGAFQWVSAHIAVPADGGRFWQLMMAENAVQGACGPQSKVKVFADQDDISMEYCNTDDDCVLSVDGKPIRHVRLDCRVALVDEQRPREFDIAKTQTMNHKVLLEQAPWFL